MIDVSKASTEELWVEAHRLAPLVAEYQQAHRAVHKEIERRQRSVAARARIGAMSADERDALKDALK